MSELLDPEHENQRLDNEMNTKIVSINHQYDDKESAVREKWAKTRSDLQNEIEKKKKIHPGDKAFTGAFVGGIIGLFLCIQPANYISNSGSGFITFLICVAIGAALFAAIAKSASDTTDLEHQIEDAKSKESNELATLKDQRCSEIDKIRKTYSKKKTNHLIEYNRLQRQASLKYIGSAVAQEITNFILVPFKQSIDSSDRRPHIMQVKVPLSFEVSRNRVECPYGKYDFTIKRVKPLEGMTDVAALANAIATAIHTDIISSYPIDPSGGEVATMEIEYEYKKDSVVAAMTYIAKNAKYVEARSL